MQIIKLYTKCLKHLKQNKVVVNSATKVLGMKPNENNKNWFNDICKNAITRRNELRKKALQNTSDECIRKYEEQKKLTNKTSTRKEENRRDRN